MYVPIFILFFLTTEVQKNEQPINQQQNQEPMQDQEGINVFKSNWSMMM